MFYPGSAHVLPANKNLQISYSPKGCTSAISQRYGCKGFGLKPGGGLAFCPRAEARGNSCSHVIAGDGSGIERVYWAKDFGYLS